jgi:hypothetical protein
MVSHELKAQTQLCITGSRLSAVDLVFVATNAAQSVKVPVLSQPQRLKVVRSGQDGAEFAITVPLQRQPLATFSARTSDRTNGGSMQLGGLERYKITQARVVGFIPAGTKNIPAFALYKAFLLTVEHAIRMKDRSAKVEWIDLSTRAAVKSFVVTTPQPRINRAASTVRKELQSAASSTCSNCGSSQRIDLLGNTCLACGTILESSV